MSYELNDVLHISHPEFLTLRAEIETLKPNHIVQYSVACGDSFKAQPNTSIQGSDYWFWCAAQEPMAAGFSVTMSDPSFAT